MSIFGQQAEGSEASSKCDHLRSGQTCWQQLGGEAVQLEPNA